MNFLKHYSRKLGFAYSLVAVSDQAVERQSLTPGEERQLASLRNPGRRRDWLAGRLAAKKASEKMFRSPDREVLNRDSGQPYFSGRPDFSLSITHNRGFALALVCRQVVGVDMEWIEPRPLSFNHYFLSSSEQAALEGKPDREEAVTLYWTRKEAVAKALGLGGAIAFKSIDTTADRIRLSRWRAEFIRMYSGTMLGYGLSIAVIEEPAAGSKVMTETDRMLCRTGEVKI